VENARTKSVQTKARASGAVGGYVDKWLSDDGRKLEHDGTGSTRTLYSLRHAYITLALLNSIDSHLIARMSLYRITGRRGSTLSGMMSRYSSKSWR